MIAKNVNYYDSVAYEKSEVVKASPGTVHRISGFNAHTSPVWIQLLDAAAVPSNGAVPKLTLYVGATANFDFDLSTIGRFCETGITVCSSSTGPTLTISGDTAWLNIQYT
jgi:hypothetical protein